MFSGTPSTNSQLLGAKADYLCLSAKYHMSLNTGKGYVLATLFVLRTFTLYISLELAELFRCTVQYNLVGQKKIEECKIKFSFLKVGHILYR